MGFISKKLHLDSSKPWHVFVAPFPQHSHLLRFTISLRPSVSVLGDSSQSYALKHNNHLSRLDGRPVGGHGHITPNQSPCPLTFLTEDPYAAMGVAPPYMGVIIDGVCPPPIIGVIGVIIGRGGGGGRGGMPGGGGARPAMEGRLVIPIDDPVIPCSSDILYSRNG